MGLKIFDTYLRLNYGEYMRLLEEGEHRNEDDVEVKNSRSVHGMMINEGLSDDSDYGSIHFNRIPDEAPRGAGFQWTDEVCMPRRNPSVNDYELDSAGRAGEFLSISKRGESNYNYKGGAVGARGEVICLESSNECSHIDLAGANTPISKEYISD
jgi:hypothetical protein